jgi:peroxiredoxin
MTNGTGEFALGSAAPNFSLTSAKGSVIKLADFRGQKNVVLYFVREFACMSCQRNAAELNRMYTDLQAQNTEVLVIGGGSSKDAERMADRLQLTFPVLGDPAREIYRNYGLSKVLGAYQRSGTFLIDKQGILRYMHQVTNPQASVDKTTLISEIKKLQTV